MKTAERKPKPAADYFDRQPPCDIQAEIGVLGSIVLLPDVLDDLRLIVGPEDFYDDAHGKLFRHFAAMHDAGLKIDPTLLIDRLRAAGELESIGGAAYLSKIINAVPNAAHAAFYAEIVREKSRLRKIIIEATQALKDAYDQDDADEITDRLESGLSTIGHSQQHEAKLLAEFADDALLDALAVSESRKLPGAMTGLHPVDQAIGPWMAGEMVTLAARPGIGKTTFAMQTATHNADKGRRVLFVSLEMRGAELAGRVLASWAGVDGRDVRLGRLTDQAKQKLNEARQHLDGLPVRLWAPPSATLADIRAQARHAKRAHGLGLLIVDYVGLVRPAADDRRLHRHEQVAAVSAGLKSLAKELEIPVLSLCQLNREADGEEPRLAHLRESGAIEQDSDVVLFLHRPEVKASKTGQSTADIHGPHEVNLIAGKHRHGQTGLVRLNWYPAECRFDCPMSF